MLTTASDYLSRWNADHLTDRISFYTHQPVLGARPTAVEVRFSPEKYDTMMTRGEWDKFQNLVEGYSTSTVYVATDQRFFVAGIIDIKVSVQSKNYSDQALIDAMMWIGETFLPERRLKRAK